jgi:hypothetical protein
MKQGDIHFHFPREKICCYFNSYTSYEKPKKNRNRRRHSPHQAIKKEGADQKKKAVKEEATLEVKEKILDEESQDHRPRKCGERKIQHHQALPHKKKKRYLLTHQTLRNTWKRRNQGKILHPHTPCQVLD